MIEPVIRILLRYGGGALFGLSTGDMLANDPDVVNLLTLGASALMGAVSEWWYARARKSGGAT